MPAFASIDCPYCGTTKAPFLVNFVGENLERGAVARQKNIKRFDVAATCPLCYRMVVAEVSTTSSLLPRSDNATGDFTSTFRVSGETYNSTVLAYYPTPLKPTAPDHLPDRISRPFMEAEHAFSMGLWSLAASGYGKTVDRAVSPLIGDGAAGKMLGPKIGMLERLKILPPAMLDWIRSVKDDRNFALHDEDMDFSSREEVEPAREFTTMLVTYLFTLPEKVKIARGLVDEVNSTPL